MFCCGCCLLDKVSRSCSEPESGIDLEVKMAYMVCRFFLETIFSLSFSTVASCRSTHLCLGSTLILFDGLSFEYDGTLLLDCFLAFALAEFLLLINLLKSFGKISNKSGVRLENRFIREFISCGVSPIIYRARVYDGQPS